MRRLALHVPALGTLINATRRRHDEDERGDRQRDGEQDLSGPALSAILGAEPNDQAGDSAKLCHCA
jgi:hypothetical protein